MIVRSLKCYCILRIKRFFISTAVSISFANDDYRAFESSGRISVVVTKDHPIASPVTLSVIPRTVSAQIESGSSLPANIPADNNISPPFASKIPENYS